MALPHYRWQWRIHYTEQTPFPNQIIEQHAHMHSYKSLSAWQHENHPLSQASMNPLRLIVHVSLLQSHILTMTPGWNAHGL